ncbi:MAG: M3 family oligoendopeptidase [Chloroflexi bacterium]|nr:M3 family oligoendopeptidase [Chloroflexota bacterium]
MILKEIWDIESIFAGGSESQELTDFLERLTTDLAACESAGVLNLLTDKTQSTWVNKIQTLYQFNVRLLEASTHVTALVFQNTKDDKAKHILTQCDELGARLGSLWTQLAASSAEQDERSWGKLLAETDLTPVAFHLNEQRDLARKKMSPKIETLANELATSGYHAWNRLYNIISGEKEMTFDDKLMSLFQLQSKFQDDPNPKIRQRAFTLFEEGWEELAQTCAFALNQQAGYRLTLYKHRGWDSALQEPLQNNRLTADTLEAMWHAIDSKSHKLLDFFAAKAKLIGVDTLSWWDVDAPIGEVSQTFSYEEAADFIVNSIANFNPDIADFCLMALKKRWVEAEDRPNKGAGAYCEPLPLSKQSRIFMTYTNSYNSVLTLAHELGHAYHEWVMRDLPFGARTYSASIAETASIFNEIIIINANLSRVTDDQERLSILGTNFNYAAGYFMDIRSRFEFETAFYKERAKKSLSVDELNALMVQSQKTAFKDGLSQYHPLFWAAKPHFYYTDTPFYNFPYTFGFLFSNGVYAQALAKGSAFKERYIALLRDTGSMGTEDLAKTHLNVDLTQPEFWETAVDNVLADVDEFVALVDKLN